jgi:hypothetical protein
MNLRSVLLLLVAITATACGETQNIQGAVRERLKDPASANFKETVVSKDGKRACIVWNAKNSFGGYGEWKVAELKMADGRWVVEEMDGSQSVCTDVGFSGLDAKVLAEAEMEKVIRKKLGQRSDCVELEVALRVSAGLLAENKAKYGENSDPVKYHKARMERLMPFLENVDCEGAKVIAME